MPRTLLTLLSLALLAATAATSRAQWQLQDAHTTADLRGIDNVGHGVAWASGSDGTILRTEDAGFVWQLCAKPPGGEHLDFRAIQAFDNNTAIIMSAGKGDLSRLYKTTDGCQTWKLLFTNPDPDGFWDALRFAPNMNFGGVFPIKARRGVLIGDPVNGKFPIFVTRNSGDTWERWETRESGSIRDGRYFTDKDCGRIDAGALKDESLFAASNDSLAVFDLDDFVFVTGGPSGSRLISTHHFNDPRSPCWISFKYQALPLGHRTASSGAFAVAATREGPYSKLVIVGGDYSMPNEASNSGVLMSPCGPELRLNEGPFCSEPASPPHGFRSAVAYDSKSNTWITVGPNGTDLFTDGRSWRQLDPNPAFNDTPDADQHWNALSLPYAVGPHGRIATLRPSALQPAK